MNDTRFFDFPGPWRRAGLALRRLAWVLLLAGCASGPPGERPGRSDRDGAPERPPADLAKVPDAEPRVEPIRQGGPNKPYVVLGQGYEPLSGDVSFRQRGVASWYGTKFHGRRTASGEVYSMYGMTAAHRTLPIPSYARVREVRTGQEVIVRINDRGPFHGNRVIDLSYTAAAKLGFLGKGSTEVEIERLTFEQIRTGQWRSGTMLAQAGEPLLATAQSAQQAAPEPFEDPIMALASRLEGARPVADAGEAGPRGTEPLMAKPAQEAQGRAYTTVTKGFWVQLAAFSQRAGVDAFQKRVADEMGHLSPLLAVFHEGAVFRLQAGPYTAREEAQAVAQRVRDGLRLVPMVVERR